MKTATVSKCLLLISLASFVASEIIVDSKAKLALKKRSDNDGTLRWCDVYYEEDFPTSAACEGKDEGQWDYFPVCCNGAYNCRNGVIWDVYLCPTGLVYDVQSNACTQFYGDVCPYVGSTTEGPVISTTTELVVSCGNVVNGKIPHPTDCTKYVLCQDKNAAVRDCLEGYVYYIPFSVCLPGVASTCMLNEI